MYCTCGCGRELGIETFCYAKKDGAFYSEDCLENYYSNKQLEFPEDEDEKIKTKKNNS